MQGKQQLCIRLLYKSLVEQCEHETQPSVPFSVMLLIQKSALLLVILLNKFVLVLFCSPLVYGRAKLVVEPQEYSNFGLGIGNFIT